MATKLYLRGTTGQLADTPSAEQSSALPSGIDYTGTIVRGDLLSTPGASDTGILLSTTASISEHSGCFGIWASADLEAQTITGSQTWTYAATGTESNNNANAFHAAALYIWRPSGSGTGSVVKTIYDAATDLDVEFLSASPTTPTSGAVISLAGAAGDFLCNAGDVIVIEGWVHHPNQGNANARNIRLFYDGATDVTSTGTGGAAYISVPQTLSFAGVANVFSVGNLAI